jgi:hypothetical protein
MSIPTLDLLSVLCDGNRGLLGSRDSVVGIATGYELDDCEVGVRVPVE